MKKYLVLFLSLIAALNLARADADPGQQYAEAFILLQDGQTAEQAADWGAALQKYSAAVDLLNSIRKAAPDWNPRHTLLFDQPSAASASSDATGTVRLRRYSGSRIEVEAETTAPGYVLINDRFDLNWRATVNNQPVTPFRTDMILYAVPVPAGRSALVLRYQSSAIPVYVHLAALGLTALIGLLGVCQPSSFVLHE